VSTTKRTPLRDPSPGRPESRLAGARAPSAESRLDAGSSISAKEVKALRDRTGAGMMDCKQALTEAQGDLERAIEILRLKQGKKIQDLGERVATEGTVQAYIHPGAKVGVLVEVDCNTDFVATNEDFVGFARDVAMQIAAAPTVRYVSREDVPAEVRDAEARIYEQEAAEKPENVRERIVAGKLDAFLQTIVLLEQELHNPKFEGKTVQQLRDELAAKTGENVVVRRFVRFAVGQ
jgi:elongation factor Ts